MTSPGTGSHPSAAQCAPVALLALKILADLRRWSGLHPVVAETPLEAMAFAAAVISPWRDAEDLRLVARMYVWSFALDDHVDQDITEQDDLDDLFHRCNAVVRTSEPDHTHPLLSALSEWQAEFSRLPCYPPLSELWVEKFAVCLDGLRYDWISGWARELGTGPSDAQEYLRYTASLLLWMTHLPYWVTARNGKPFDHLDVPTAAFADIEVAIRLANDLATYSRERTQPGQNNILMYDTTPDWVVTESRRHADSARQLLAPLIAQGFRPADELGRLLDWSLSFYALADFRGWGSDNHVHGSFNR